MLGGREGNKDVELIDSAGSEWNGAREVVRSIDFGIFQAFRVGFWCAPLSFELVLEEVRRPATRTTM